MKIEVGQRYKDRGNPEIKFTVIATHGDRVWLMNDNGEHSLPGIAYIEKYLTPIVMRPRTLADCEERRAYDVQLKNGDCIISGMFIRLGDSAFQVGGGMVFRDEQCILEPVEMVEDVRFRFVV